MEEKRRGGRRDTGTAGKEAIKHHGGRLGVVMRVTVWTQGGGRGHGLNDGWTRREDERRSWGHA